MTKNPILDELRETRERLLAEAGGTLDGLVAKLQRDERGSDREFAPPKNRCVEATKAGDLAMIDKVMAADDAKDPLLGSYQ